MAKVKVMFWKDIPCSVMATEKGASSARRQLPDMYMTFVDTIAMKEGTTAAQDYQNAFRWGKAEERDGTPDEVADSMVAEVLEKYPRAWLMQRSREAKPDSSSADSSSADPSSDPDAGGSSETS